MEQAITLYGADWCHHTAKARRHLDALEVAFHYVNVDANPMAGEEVMELNGGAMCLPTVVIEAQGTRILAQPSLRDLTAALVETDVIDDQTFHRAS